MHRKHIIERDGVRARIEIHRDYAMLFYTSEQTPNHETGLLIDNDDVDSLARLLGQASRHLIERVPPDIEDAYAAIADSIERYLHDQACDSSESVREHLARVVQQLRIYPHQPYEPPLVIPRDDL